MNLFYKCLLSIFCFTCVSATATPTQITPPAFIEKPSFNIDNSAFPSCDCDEQGKPLLSCQEQTAKASVRAVIDKNGKPTNIIMVKSSGSVKADRDIVQRFRSARFSPAMQNNQPIVSSGQQAIIINYKPELSSLTCPIEKPKNQELLKQIHNFN